MTPIAITGVTPINITDAERHEVAARLRKAIGLHEFAEVLGFDWTDESDWVWNDVSNLVADLIEPPTQCPHYHSDRHYCSIHDIPATDRMAGSDGGWTSFDERPPEPGEPVLCKGKNGAYYVGKPVTYDGRPTGEVWVSRGAGYRSPAAWKPVD